MEITPEIARIPEAICRRAAKKDEWLFDVLMNVAVVDLVNASRVFDPARSPGGSSTFAAFCVWQIEKRVFQKIRRLKKQRGGRVRREILLSDFQWLFVHKKSKTTNNQDTDNQESVARILDRLGCVERDLLMAWCRGVSLVEMARMWNITPRGMNYKINKILDKLKKSTKVQRTAQAKEPRTSTGGKARTLPVGTVREMTHKKRRVRMIKVTATGPAHKRWVAYARWNWEQHHGPVPEGMHVHFKDGDHLNDGITNLFLAKPGKGKNLANADEQWKERAARASSKSNKERALARKLSQPLEDTHAWTEEER